MNLIEAIKTSEYIYRESKPDRIVSAFLEREMWDLTRQDILAEDWVISEPAVMVTRKQFDATWDRYIKRFDKGPERDAMIAMVNLLAVELGLV